MTDLFLSSFQVTLNNSSFFDFSQVTLATIAKDEMPISLEHFKSRQCPS